MEQMPPSLPQRPVGVLARSRRGGNHGDDAAAPLFAEIAGLRDFYGYLAADRLKQPYNLNVRPSALDVAAQTALSNQPG